MQPTFNSPEEEIAYLRAQIAGKMEQAKGFEGRFTEKDRAHEVVREYKSVPVEKVVSPYNQVTAGEEHKLLA